MLENLYMIFRIYPFGAPKIRAVKKEAKHYHIDWNLIENEGGRLENMVACHLLKWCYFIQDFQGYAMELRYFRDVDKREVDFVILKNGDPIHFIECKLSDRDVNPALRYLKKRFPSVKASQIYFDKGRDLVTKDGIRVCPAHDFLMDF